MFDKEFKINKKEKRPLKPKSKGRLRIHVQHQHRSFELVIKQQ